MNWSELENALKDRVEKELEEELESLIDSLLNSENSSTTPTVPNVPSPPGAKVVYAVPEKTVYGDPSYYQGNSIDSLNILVFSGERSDYTTVGYNPPVFGILNEDEVVEPIYDLTEHEDPEGEIIWGVINEDEVVEPIYGWKENEDAGGERIWGVINEDEVVGPIYGYKIWGIINEDEVVGPVYGYKIVGIINKDEVVSPIYGYKEPEGLYPRVFYVEDNNGLEGPFTIYDDIDRLYFNNEQAVAIDVAPGEVAGEVYRIYKAAFGREPDSFGMGYWIAQMDNGMDMIELAARFIDSDEFRTLYGENPTDTEFLDKLYENVLDREPDEGGYSWWQYELANNPSKTREKVLTDFSEGWENSGSVANLIADGIPYSIWS